MAGQLTIDTLRAGSGVLATQNGMTGIAKAWVNYDGIVQTVRASFNVSSVTYNSTGNYTINYTTALSSQYYSAQIACSATVGNGGQYQFVTGGMTTTTCQVETLNYTASANTNRTNTYVVIHGA
jgi:hypothetical protein